MGRLSLRLSRQLEMAHVSDFALLFACFVSVPTAILRPTSWTRKAPRTRLEAALPRRARTPWSDVDRLSRRVRARRCITRDVGARYLPIRDRTPPPSRRTSVSSPTRDIILGCINLVVDVHVRCLRGRQRRPTRPRVHRTHRRLSGGVPQQLLQVPMARQGGVRLRRRHGHRAGQSFLRPERRGLGPPGRRRHRRLQVRPKRGARRRPTRAHHAGRDRGRDAGDATGGGARGGRRPHARGDGDGGAHRYQRRARGHPAGASRGVRIGRGTRGPDVARGGGGVDVRGGR